MASKRRQQLLLAGVALVLALVIYRAWSPTSAGQPPASKVATATRGAGGRGGSSSGAAAPADVHLGALEAERPKPAEVERNLFRFKPKAPPPPPPRPQGPGGGGQAPVVTGPPPPPPLPPIPYRFIGVLEQGSGKPTIAVLSDRMGNVFHGVEGDTIEGRYKILKIGVESIEMAYLDGRGRQTIRLTG